MDTKGNFEKFKSDIMQMLLDGENDTLLILRKQYLNAKMTTEFTGVGFFTHFEIPESVSKLDPPRSFQIGDIHCQMNGLQYGAGFVIFVKNGTLIMLEGYTYDEKWPDVITDYHLSYLSGENLPSEERDMEKLELDMMPKGS